MAARHPGPWQRVLQEGGRPEREGSSKKKRRARSWWELVGEAGKEEWEGGKGGGGVGVFKLQTVSCDFFGKEN